jgi:hypothetical protein
LVLSPSELPFPQPPPPSRTVSAPQVSGATRTAIPGSVHPKVTLSNDLGSTAEDTKLVGMTIRFNMTPAQTAALDQLLVNLQDPSSPQFHQWLTPAQFAAQFGLSTAPTSPRSNPG